MRCPFRTDLEHALWSWKLAHSVGALNSLLDSEIEIRENVGAAETEHEEHLRGPAPYAFDRGESCDDVVIGQLVQVVDRHITGVYAGCEIAQVANLLAREPDSAHLLVGQVDQLVCDGGLVVEQGRETAVDGGCGLARELLKNDRARDGREVRHVFGGRKRAGADCVDDRGELGVGLSEVGDGAFMGHVTKLFDPSFARSRPYAEGERGADRASRGRIRLRMSRTSYHNYDGRGANQVTFGVFAR